MRPAQPNQSLIDGLACLQALSGQSRPIGSRELGRQLGLEPTRANRLLKTLAYMGLAQQDASRRYLPGPGIHVLAAQSMRGSGLIRRALGPLESLKIQGFQVAMGSLWRDQVCYLYHAFSGDAHGFGLSSAPVFPAARSGIGHALLAAFSDDQIREVMSEADHRSSAAADDDAVDVERLLSEIATARERGFAVVRTSAKARTVAVALPSDAAAIGVFGEFEDAQIPDLVQRVRHTARHINEADIVPGPADYAIRI